MATPPSSDPVTDAAAGGVPADAAGTSRPITLSLEQKLENLPTNSGVYLYKDRDGSIIYVGKAVNLRNRVRSYFPKVGRLTRPKPSGWWRRSPTWNGSSPTASWRR
jgi:hypothetical protein